MNPTKINAIIVDDNKEFCYILKDYLSSQVDIVVTGIGHDGVAALKLIQEKQPDLVVLDMIMPRLDGLGVLEAINTISLNVMPKIIVFSAVGTDKLTQRAFALGADYYIVKPFNLDEFGKKVKEMFSNDNSSDPVTKTTTIINDLNITSNKNEIIDLENQITNVLREIMFLLTLKDTCL